MEKVLQILTVLALLMLAINYYIKAEKTKFRFYHAIGRDQAPADLLWLPQGMDPDNQLLFRAGHSAGATGNTRTTNGDIPINTGQEDHEGLVEVLDANTGEILTHLTVGAGPGTQVFDPETRILYSANGEGTLSIFRQVNRETYKLLQTLKTHPGCPLMAFDARTKKIYLSVKGFLPAEGLECWVFSNG
jgi:hypothetical protein